MIKKVHTGDYDFAFARLDLLEPGFFCVTAKPD